MEYYLVVKKIHILTAILSVIGFAIRGWWTYKDNPVLQKKLVKILPHINDTLLLAAAIYLSLMSGLYPFHQSWLGIKVILLISYIVAGTIALKRGKTQQSRLIAFWVAIASIGLIFLHAFYRPVYW